MKLYSSFNIEYCVICIMDQGEPGVDYDDPNLNPLICDLCKETFDSLDKLGEHQKKKHTM
jgi:C2H2-type zinc finger protein